ncbi:MAG TPA: hypothetical protein VII23_05290 [Terriglobales bacterium]|jgi:hypothetical protein
MTCREFIESAESLSPLQLKLMESKNENLSAHARECSGCGRWMESQRLLGGALQVLRAQTAQREASPNVELAVLQAFRAQGFEPVADVAPHRAAPAAWQLSRFFEVGAYLAVAAALIVGLFLGERMWRDRQAPPAQAQVQKTPAPQAPKLSDDKLPERLRTETAQKSANSAGNTGPIASAKRPQVADAKSVATTIDRQGFVAMMLCDPLICSGEEQVIRMELPGNASTSADGNGNQPVIADVVVGDDGLVRAMRIVNQ